MCFINEAYARFVNEAQGSWVQGARSGHKDSCCVAMGYKKITLCSMHIHINYKTTLVMNV